MNSVALGACRELLLALGVMLLAWAAQLTLSAGPVLSIAAIVGAVAVFLSRRALTRRFSPVSEDVAKNTKPFLPRWLRGLLAMSGRVVLVIVYFSVLGSVSYALYAEPRAKQAARDFCASVMVGEDPDAVLDRAKATSALKSPSSYYMRWIGPPEARKLSVTFVGRPPFSRHSCIVEAGAAVTGARYTYLD